LGAGDFVKAKRLEEGDFIVIYLDVKCGKFIYIVYIMVLVYFDQV
jgi:hypothetical protein